ncbi:MAG: VWA domain-containing protein [Pseudomonadales bacterium]|nr:VWA domain-containing protein [Pseudomonadales bacterium]
MKDLFKSSTKNTTTEKKAGGDLVSSKQDVANFLNKVASLPKTGGEARLIFALDATASRQPTWDIATQLQAEMFSSAHSLGGLNLQLCYFRGFGEFFASDWQSDGDSLLGLMTRIHCEAGATQLARVLRHAISEHQVNRLKGLVFIGDAMEESRDTLAQLAGKLGLLNVPLFMFQERGDPLAREVFMELCRLSGGAYSQFDAASAEQLKELLQAVAVYAAGGLQALEDFSKTSNQAVKLLEQQLKP